MAMPLMFNVQDANGDNAEFELSMMEMNMAAGNTVTNSTNAAGKDSIDDSVYDR